MYARAILGLSHIGTMSKYPTKATASNWCLPTTSGRQAFQPRCASKVISTTPATPYIHTRTSNASPCRVAMPPPSTLKLDLPSPLPAASAVADRGSATIAACRYRAAADSMGLTYTTQACHHGVGNRFNPLSEPRLPPALSTNPRRQHQRCQLLLSTSLRLHEHHSQTRPARGRSAAAGLRCRSTGSPRCRRSCVGGTRRSAARRDKKKRQKHTDREERFA